MDHGYHFTDRISYLSSVDTPGSKATPFKSNYDPRSQLAFDVLAEFGIVTSHAIVDIMGEEQAEALVRSEMYHAGLAMALNIKNRMGLEGHDLFFVAYAANWANSIMGMDQKVEVTDIGARVLVKSCPLSRASRALCCHIVYCPKGFHEILAPGFISLNPKRLSRGDGTCVIISLKEGVNPDQVLTAPCIYEPLPPPLDPEERVRWNHSYIGGMWTLMLKSMLEEIGPEMTMNALRSKFNEIGRGFAPRFKEEYPMVIEDPGSVADELSSFHSSFLKEGRFMSSSDGFSIITEECPFSGEPSEVCQLFQCFYDGLLERTDPELSMRCSGMMTKGDRTCHWLIGKKGRTASKDDALPEDLIKVLKLRYAKGEITREEYQRMKEELLE
jgi:hypothetical protein